MRKYLILKLLLLFQFFFADAQSILSPGDLAVIAHNNDNADQIVLLALTPVLQGTVIRITDNAWNGSVLAASEGTWTYTFPSNVAAGSRINLIANSPGVTSAGSWDLSTSGDQIFVYQGTSSNPIFIYGFSSRAWVTGSTNLTTSRLPSSLVNGKTARDFPTEVDNGYYNPVSTTGNKDFILTQIGTTSKWTRSNNRYSSFPSISFTLNTLASEPVGQPSLLSFSSVLTWSYQVNWMAPSSACDGYLVLRADNGSGIAGAPLDGVVYSVGDPVGNAKVAYAGSATAYVQKGGVVASGTYSHAVFAYNGSGTDRNYRQISPLVGSVSTPSTGEGTYYALIDTSSPVFVSQLQGRIRSPFNSVAYAQFDETMVANVEYYDTTGGQKVATCVYSGQRFIYTPPFAWTPTTPFSREHTWCHSWMPSYSSTSTSEYADQHHLFVVNQNNSNAVRSNHPLGEVVSLTSSFLGGAYGTDASGNNVYEPVANHKGNAARALLYMSLRYDGVNGMNWSFDHLNNVILPMLNEDPQDLQLLLQWHAMDPPDAAEIARNDYIQSIQGNRNPFVDRPTWVDLVDFTLVSARIRNESTASGKSNQGDCKINMFPNPLTHDLNLMVDIPVSTSCKVVVSTLDGRVVNSVSYDLLKGPNRIRLDMSDLFNGAYLVSIQSDIFSVTRRIVKVSP